MKAAFTAHAATAPAAAELAEGLAPAGPGVRAVLFFCSQRHDGAALGAALSARFPGAEVVGCTTAGEFGAGRHGHGGASALALTAETVGAVAGAVTDPNLPVREGLQKAAQSLGERLGSPLRELDPTRHVGVVLAQGVGGHEEEINEELGNLAPLLSFVGGSAGDGREFQRTVAFHGGRAAPGGTALLVLEMRRPFQVLKTCSFEPAGPRLKVTRADPAARIIHELDGRPAAQAYAEAVGQPLAQVRRSVLMRHPLGQLIGGSPWIRSPDRVLPDGAMSFFCRVPEGITLELMRPTDLVADTRAALERTGRELGGLRGGLAFNCVLRLMEIEARALDGPFYACFDGLELAGFHTYGESWLGHMNQTLTALLFG